MPEHPICSKCGRWMKQLDPRRTPWAYVHMTTDDAFDCGRVKPPLPVFATHGGQA